jgi:hypothetical protein
MGLSLSLNFHGGHMEVNSTTVDFVGETIEHWSSRPALIHAGTKLFCQANGLEEVTDFQPLAKTVSLACGCKRPLFDPQIVAAFEKASATLPKKKRVKGSNQKIDVEATYVEELDDRVGWDRFARTA